MFIVSKVADFLLSPLAVLLALLGVGTALLYLPRCWRLGRAVLTAALAGLLPVTALPLDQWGINRLENRFAAVEPGMVTGIVVLGGAIDPVLSAVRGQTAMGAAAERMTEAVALARRHPRARLIFSGGSGAVTERNFTEAPAAGRLFRDLGIAPERIELEGESRNTWENARLTLEMARPAPGERWLLVTSALHMPRAMAAFAAAGWQDIAPYPVDYLTRPEPGWWPPRLSPAAALSGWSSLGHELLGLAYYRLRGWN